MTEYYNKHLSEPWFTLIKIGSKKIEGRINKGEYGDMKKNDTIEFTNNDLGFNRTFKVKIISTHKYDTFLEYLNEESLKKCLPGIDTIQEGVDTYYKYYKKEDEKKYKITALRIQVIK
jgi:ASC-1-like (ASCH) protein